MLAREQEQTPAPQLRKSLALRDIRDITYRHLFIRHFIPLIRNLRHAFLQHEGETLTELSLQPKLQVVVDRKELNEWKALFKRSQFIEKVYFRRKSHLQEVKLVFKDGCLLTVNLIHSFRKKNFIFSDVQSFLDSARPNWAGIMVASHTFTFEFLIMSSCLGKTAEPAKVRRYLQRLLPDEYNQIVEYLRQKYRVTIETLESLIECLQEYRKQLIETLLSLPANQGMARLVHSWDYFWDTTIDFLPASSAYVYAHSQR